MQNNFIAHNTIPFQPPSEILKAITQSSTKSAFTPVIQHPQVQSPLYSVKESITPLQKLVYCQLLANEEQEKAQQAFQIKFQNSLSQTPLSYLSFFQQRQRAAQQLYQCVFSQQNLIQKKADDVKSFVGNSEQSSLSCNEQIQSNTLKQKIEKQASSDLNFEDHESTNYSLSQKEQVQDSLDKQNSKVFICDGIILENYLVSDNLNECVDALLRKEKLNPSNLEVNKIIRHNNAGKGKDRKKRLRKNKGQSNILLEAYFKNPNWDKKIIQKLSDELGLKESQIYKWNWDQRKKDVIPQYSNMF